jgi:hypothetical protein
MKINKTEVDGKSAIIAGLILFPSLSLWILCVIFEILTFGFKGGGGMPPPHGG